MKSRNKFSLVALTLVSGVQSAFANQPPGPMVMLPEISLLPLMMLFTAAGGGYSVLHRVHGKKSNVGKAVAAVVAIVLSGAHEGYGFLLALAFGSGAGLRGLHMILWGLAARRSIRPKDLSESKPGVKKRFIYFDSRTLRPEDLAGVSPIRLLTAGACLIVVSLFLSGMAVAFVGFWEITHQTNREKAFKELAAFQLFYAGLQESKTGLKTFRQLSAADPENVKRFYVERIGRFISPKLEYGPDLKSFSAYLPPRRFPFFPYNYLASQPSYRADQSGHIRMMRVHYAGELCPPDAAVVMRISDEDIREVSDWFKENQ